MTGDKTKNNQGYSLIEMVVSLAIFVMLITIVTSIFQSIVRSQYNAIAAQTVQESMRYALEAMSKEIRSSASSTSDCLSGVPTNKVFEKDTDGFNDRLFFRNKYDECVRYRIDSGRLMVARGADPSTYIEMPITPDEVNILSLSMDVLENDVDPDCQPKVTLVMEVEMDSEKDKQNMKIQTTISARYYQ